MRSLVPLLLLIATCSSASAQRFVKVFDNVAAMLAANPNDVHTNAYVAGRTIANDGGGGIYTWHSASTASTNSNLSILKANNFSTGRWLRDNGFVLTALTTDRVAVIGSDSVLTNGIITITQLNMLSNVTSDIQEQIDNIIAGNNNWQNEGDTNSTLPGIGKPWAIEATNHITVGIGSTSPGIIDISSTNGTHTVRLTVDEDGTLVIAHGSTNMLTLQLGSLAGHTGTGTNFLSDDGTFKFVAGGGGDNLWTNLNGTVYAVSDGADGTTAFAIGTDATRTSGNLLNITNGTTLVVEVNHLGNITIGPNSTGTYGPLGNAAIESVRYTADGEQDATGFFFESADSGAFTADAYSQHYLSTAGTTNASGQHDIFAVTAGGSLVYSLYVKSDSGNTNNNQITLSGLFGGKGFNLEPTMVDGTAPYSLGSVLTHSTGDILAVLNNGTNVFTVAAVSGHTGAGAKSFYDDGTFKYRTKTLPLLRFPDSVDGAGCTYVNTNDFTARTFMRPRFSAAGATNANFATFSCLVPADLNTSVDLTATLKVSLVAGDTAASTYTVGMASVANSASSSPTAANYITLTVPADGSGSAGDVEGVNTVTLTGWRSNMTAGQWLFIQLQRDGSDASATDEDLLALEITYTSTQ